MDELSELQARIHARQVQRQLEADIVDNARRDDSPGQFGDATNTPGGLTRSRSEFDNGQLDEDEFAGQMFNQIYTVEMGRTYKRHKGLSAEADADAEKFVKVRGNSKDQPQCATQESYRPQMCSSRTL